MGFQTQNLSMKNTLTDFLAKPLRMALPLLLIFFCLSQTAFAVEGKDLPEEKRTKLNLYVTAPEAAALKTQLGDKALFLDIRASAEIMFLGSPTATDAMVPFVDFPRGELSFDEKRGTYKLEPNTGFVAEVARRLAEKGLDKNDVIILMCRSGDRSSRAINHQLADLGYTKVHSVVDGFEGDISKDGRRSINGWKNANLPWTYKMEKAKIYMPK